MIAQKDIILTAEDFNDYLREHKEELLHRDGRCKKCSYRLKCMESVRWNILNRLSKEPDSIVRQIKTFFCRNAPGVLVRQMYVRRFLPCSHTAVEILKEKDDIFQLFEKLDHESVRTLTGLLMYRITGDDAYTSAVDCGEEQYFTKPLRNMPEQAAVVDCGAFTGDTLEAYLKYNPAPRAYWLYEAKAEYIEDIRKTVRDCAAEKYAEIRPVGVWSESTTLWFSPGKHGGAGGGFVSHERNKLSMPVNVVSLDDDIKSAVTFIKMDIEGAEEEALKGAHRLISDCHPRLAICIYHRTTDLWRIPLYLLDRYPSYAHCEIRHHKHHSVGDTVLYLY